MWKDKLVNTLQPCPLQLTFEGLRFQNKYRGGGNAYKIIYITKTLDNWKRKYLKKSLKVSFGVVFLQVASFSSKAYLGKLDVPARWGLQESQGSMGAKVGSITSVVRLE